MATPDGENIYDTIGTVLYCTVPVISTTEAVPTQDISDALNIPLDYETALAMQEAKQALAVQNVKGGKGVASAGAAGQTGAAATRSTGSLPLAAADAHQQPASSILAGNGLIPAPPPQRVGLPNMSARYGTQNAAAGILKGGIGAGSGGSTQPQQLMKGDGGNVGGQGRRNSPQVGFSEGAATAFDSVAAHNVSVAKTVSARSASTAAASSKHKHSALKGMSTTTTAAAARLANGPRTGDRALTVADAMEFLFPISLLGADGNVREVGDSADVMSDVSSRKSSASSSAIALSRHAKSDGVESTHAGEGASSGASAPRLWRRADVGHTSRLDVVLLYLHLQHRCATESARPRGVVCLNRERLYCDTLQELTRQITLLCPELGLLLNELSCSMQQSIDTYDVLMDSANQYAVRKSTERDLHQHLFAEKAELEAEVRRREHRVSEWRAKYAGLQKRLLEQQAADEKLHEQEIAYAKKANMQLVNEIKRLASEAEKAREN